MRGGGGGGGGARWWRWCAVVGVPPGGGGGARWCAVVEVVRSGGAHDDVSRSRLLKTNDVTCPQHVTVLGRWPIWVVISRNFTPKLAWYGVDWRGCVRAVPTK